MTDKLTQHKQGQILPAQPQSSLLQKSEVIVGYLQQMALPSMWNRELTTEDFQLWDQVLNTYSIAAIKFSFETWIRNGRRFPIPNDIEPLCVSHHEQEAAAENYKPKRGERLDGGHAQILMVWSMVVDRIADFKEREESYQPLTITEFEGMLVQSKEGGYIPRQSSSKYFPNGNARYNRELVQFLQAKL